MDTDLASERGQVLADLPTEHPLLVDGHRTDGRGEPLTVHDPSTGAALARVATADPQDVDTAVRAARRAHDREWSRLPGAERGEAVLRLARAVRERAGELAALESLGTGAPLRQTTGHDLPAVLAHLVHHAGWADKLAHAGFGPGPDGAGPRARGVVALLVPDTSSLVDAVRSIAPALAAGNAVLLVPAVASPLAALRLAGLAQQADLPPGLLTVLPGGEETRAAVTAHPGRASITVTGSSSDAAAVQRRLAGRAARLHLELRGPSTTVLLADADPDRAAAALAASVAAHHQLAGAGARVLVHHAVAGALRDALHRELTALVVGDALDLRTDVGPLATGARHAVTVAALAASDTPWSSGAVLPARGWFVAPSMLRSAAVDVPGPVLAVETVTSVDDVVLPGGRGGWPVSVFSADGSAAVALAHRWRRDVVHDGCPLPALGHGGGPATLEGYLDVPR